MSATPELTALDRAELEVNRVLEQIGRIFAAANASQQGTALAIATRMKQILPVSASHFHNALDELDQQLQLAKSIMRRDLALLNRDPTEQKEPVLSHDPPKPGADTKSIDAVASSDVKPEPVPVDAASSATAQVEAQSVAPPVAASRTQDPSVDAAVTDDSSKPPADTDAVMEDRPPQEPLKLDTDNAVNSAANNEAALKAPDTAFSANADMDSLFNDPVTAGGDDQPDNNLIDFSNGANDTDVFDFDDFDANLGANDQLGLQNYTGADDQAGAEPDFSALFGTATGQDGLTSTDQPADEQQLHADQDIFNFDEMMNIGITADDDNNAGDSSQQDGQFTVDLS